MSRKCHETVVNPAFDWFMVISGRANCGEEGTRGRSREGEEGTRHEWGRKIEGE